MRMVVQSDLARNLRPASNSISIAKKAGDDSPGRLLPADEVGRSKLDTGRETRSSWKFLGVAELPQRLDRFPNSRSVESSAVSNTCSELGADICRAQRMVRR